MAETEAHTEAAAVLLSRTKGVEGYRGRGGEGHALVPAAPLSSVWGTKWATTWWRHSAPASELDLTSRLHIRIWNHTQSPMAQQAHCLGHGPSKTGPPARQAGNPILTPAPEKGADALRPRTRED